MHHARIVAAHVACLCHRASRSNRAHTTRVPQGCPLAACAARPPPLPPRRRPRRPRPAGRVLLHVHARAVRRPRAVPAARDAPHAAARAVPADQAARARRDRELPRQGARAARGRRGARGGGDTGGAAGARPAAEPHAARPPPGDTAVRRAHRQDAPVRLHAALPPPRARHRRGALGALPVAHALRQAGRRHAGAAHLRRRHALRPPCAAPRVRGLPPRPRPRRRRGQAVLQRELPQSDSTPADGAGDGDVLLELQPHLLEVATPCLGGCNPMCPR